MVKCLRCKDHFDRVMIDQRCVGKIQVCKGCAEDVRVERRTELKRHRENTLKDKLADQQFERDARAEKIKASIKDGARETPVLHKYSKTGIAKIRHELAVKLEDKRIAREFGINVEDFTGDSNV